MAAIKEKKITVESVIEDIDAAGIAESSEKCRTECDAFFRADGDNYSITYREVSEGGVIDTDITVSRERVTVKRTGAIASVFNFAEGLCERSVYKMPPYEFDAEITTVKIRNNLTRDGGNLTILYGMNIGGSNRRVRMRVSVPND